MTCSLQLASVVSSMTIAKYFASQMSFFKERNTERAKSSMISFCITGDDHLYPLLSSHNFNKELSAARNFNRLSKFPVVSVCPLIARPCLQR